MYLRLNLVFMARRELAHAINWESMSDSGLSQTEEKSEAVLDNDKLKIVPRSFREFATIPTATGPWQAR